MKNDHPNEKKYFALYRTLKDDIENGKYKTSEKLPSKRRIAELSGHSLVTVEHACRLLEDEGYIMPKERRGYFVCDLSFLRQGDQSIQAPRAFDIKHLPEPTEEYKQDFAYSLWFKTIRKVIADQDSRLFLKAPNQGCEVLRNAIADFLVRYRSMAADPKNIVIGSGAEQLYETAHRLLGADKTYAIESPCYRQIETVYDLLEQKVCRLSMGEDGIRSEEFDEKSFDVLHITPHRSFPSGITTSPAKKALYLDWVAKPGRYIIEDDFAGEFFLPGQPIKTLYSMDRTGSVVYINTFSKSLSPSMRIGYMILSDALLEKYLQKLGKLSCSVPVLDQYILAEFIRSGNFERHLNRMRKRLLP